MKTAIAAVCGIIFGIGLCISGMTNPAKVLAFLDVAGSWDPTLALVMGAALSVSTAGYALARGRERSWLGHAFDIPTRADLDPSLIGGAILFGLGWGLVGLCPGPALANLSRASGDAWMFAAAMVVGILGYRAANLERG